jgi:hypothetical protein
VCGPLTTHTAHLAFSVQYWLTEPRNSLRSPAQASQPHHHSKLARVGAG